VSIIHPEQLVELCDGENPQRVIGSAESDEKPAENPAAGADGVRREPSLLEHVFGEGRYHGVERPQHACRFHQPAEEPEPPGGVGNEGRPGRAASPPVGNPGPAAGPAIGGPVDLIRMDRITRAVGRRKVSDHCEKGVGRDAKRFERRAVVGRMDQEGEPFRCQRAVPVSSTSRRRVKSRTSSNLRVWDG
jgi:hypothetical protein